jgi:deoxyadenosine/deoxycytidine kinase
LIDLLKNTKKLPELVIFFTVSLPNIKKRLYHKDKITKKWKEDMAEW